MARKRFSERAVIETLAWQGYAVACFRCRRPFFELVFNSASKVLMVKPLLPIEREHIHELALGGGDVPGNCRYSCSNCHRVITGGTKATSAGSSKQRIAKVKRLRNPKPSRHPMKSSGRKIPSRPFQKRAKP